MYQTPKAQDFLVKPFSPCAFYNGGMNFLYVLERDCLTVTHPGNKSGSIDLLRDVDGELVGVQINSFSHIAKWDILDAIIGQYPAWFRFLYHMIKKHRDRKLMREMKAAGFPA